MATCYEIKSICKNDVEKYYIVCSFAYKGKFLCSIYIERGKASFIFAEYKCQSGFFTGKYFVTLAATL